MNNSYRDIVHSVRAARLFNSWSDAARQASAEARRAKARSPEDAKLYSKFAEQHDRDMDGSGFAYRASAKAYTSGSIEDHTIAAKAHAQQAKFIQEDSLSPDPNQAIRHDENRKIHEGIVSDLLRAQSKASNRANYFSIISNRTASSRVARLVERGAARLSNRGVDVTGVTLIELKRRAEIAALREADKNDLTVFDDDHIANCRCTGIYCKLPEERINNHRFAMPSDGWIHIAPKGEHPHPKGLVQVLDDESINRMVSNFKDQKRDPNFPGLLVDRDHVSQTGTTEAAGWITNLQARPDGLWANVAWTSDGKADVENGTFRMVSPVWKRSDCVPVNGKPTEYCRPIALDSLALTNDPNMKGLVPITKVV